MAESVKVIDPDMGSGYDYDSLFDWEAAQQADIDASNTIAVAKCRCTGGTADTTDVTIDGWTTSAADYIKVWTDPAESYRHNGTYQTGNKYRLETSSAYSLITNSEVYTRIIGLQIYNNYNSNSCAGISLGAVGSVSISHCVIRRGSFARTSYGIDASGIQDIKFYNNIFYDWTPTDSSACYGIRFSTISSDNNSIIANNTFHNCRIGIAIGSNKYVRIINNIFRSCAVAPMSSETCQAGSGYNATDVASLGYTVDGGATGDRVSQTFTFSNEASDDFHLASTDAGALGFGLNLYNDADLPFQTDIDGQDRGGAAAAWDIGADEYVASGATDLVVADSYSQTVADTINVIQEHELSVSDGASASVGESVSISSTGEDLLTVTDGAVVSAADSAVLEQEHNLVNADGASVSVSDALDLVQEHELILSDGASVSVCDSADLVQEHELAASDGAQQSVGEALTLIQEHELSVSDSASQAVGEDVTLTVESADAIQVQDGVVVTVGDSLDLVQEHNLVVSDAAVAAFGETLTLIEAGLDLLVVADGVVVSAADSFEVSQEQGLTVADGLSVSIVDALVLLQEHMLETSDCYNPNHADNVNLEIEHWLAISDAVVKNTTDAIRLYSLILGPIIDPYLLSITAKMKLESITPAWMVESITTRRTIKQGEL